MTRPPTWPLERVISGAQTGADQAGLEAAVVLGYPTGGMMPRGWKTEAGPRPDLGARFGLTESGFTGYEHRTRFNVHHSDGTVICIVGALDGGSALTKSMADALQRPTLVCYVPPSTAPLEIITHAINDIRGWVLFHQVHQLNVAGNRESKSPGVYDRTFALLVEALRRG